MFAIWTGPKFCHFGGEFRDMFYHDFLKLFSSQGSVDVSYEASFLPDETGSVTGDDVTSAVSQASNATDFGFTVQEGSISNTGKFFLLQLACYLPLCGVFSPLTSAETCEKSSRWLWKGKLC